MIEQGEADGTISLNTLKKAADGLDCDLVYFLVPRAGSLAKIREEQAYLNAKSINHYVEQHMALENQATSKEYQQQEIEKTRNEYLKNWSFSFWKRVWQK